MTLTGEMASSGPHARGSARRQEGRQI